MGMNILKNVALFLVLVLLTAGCGGGGGGSSDDSSQGGTTSLNPIEARVITTDLTPQMSASIDATLVDIQGKIEASIASESFSGVSASSSYAGATPTPDENKVGKYHLADVIFTLGTDDLSTVAANELEENAAYNYFKTYVVDAGKLSQEDADQFRLLSINEFNDAFVEGYYEAAGVTIGASAAASGSYTAAMASLPVYNGNYATGANGQPKRIFGFFKIFNPFTYMKIFINIAKTVMTAILAQAFKVMLLSGTMTCSCYALRLSFQF